MRHHSSCNLHPLRNLLLLHSHHQNSPQNENPDFSESKPPLTNHPTNHHHHKSQTIIPPLKNAAADHLSKATSSPTEQKRQHQTKIPPLHPPHPHRQQSNPPSSRKRINHSLQLFRLRSTSLPRPPSPNAKSATPSGIPSTRMM